MAYDEALANRIRTVLSKRQGIVEKRMFGGIAFMLSGNMCCGVIGDSLVARVGPAQYDAALGEPCTREMDFTGRPMRGFVVVALEGVASDEGLQHWVDRCVSFAASLPPK